MQLSSFCRAGAGSLEGGGLGGGTEESRRFIEPPLFLAPRMLAELRGIAIGWREGGRSESGRSEGGDARAPGAAGQGTVWGAGAWAAAGVGLRGAGALLEQIAFELLGEGMADDVGMAASSMASLAADGQLRLEMLPDALEAMRRLCDAIVSVQVHNHVDIAPRRVLHMTAGAFLQRLSAELPRRL